MRLVLGLLIICPLVWCQASLEPQSQPNPTTEDVESGERLYLAQCGSCHGPRGNGGRGANLARPRLRHAADNAALYKVIRSGIRGTEMPRSALSEQQIWQVVAFVRTLGRVEQSLIVGDMERGAKLYTDKGNCNQCHAVGGHGGGIGPALDEVGARRSADYLRQKLQDPEAAVATDFLHVRVITTDGRRIAGTRLNEDAFSIQIRDLSNTVHSFWKSELTELYKDWGKSSMPNYKPLLKLEEIDDIVAYLVSLQGRP